jgi:hypothetical protein
MLISHISIFDANVSICVYFLLNLLFEVLAKMSPAEIAEFKLAMADLNERQDSQEKVCFIFELFL